MCDPVTIITFDQLHDQSVRRVAHIVAVHHQDHVALQQTGLLGGTSGLGALHVDRIVAGHLDGEQNERLKSLQWMWVCGNRIKMSD